MNKKDYQKPTMVVVKFQPQCHILTGSGVQSRRSGYGAAQVDEWDEE